MQIVFKLGIITNVDVSARKISFADIISSNLTNVAYPSVYFADISEHQLIPQTGYYVLFCVLTSIPGRQDLVLPIKYFSSTINGDTADAIKQLFLNSLQAEGDQVLASKGGSAVVLQEKALQMISGVQSLEINNGTSTTTLDYNSLLITGSDNFTIKQAQGTNELVISKLDARTKQPKTTVTISNDTVTVNTVGTLKINASDISIVDKSASAEPTVKGTSLQTYINNHIHSNGNNGSPTGTPITQMSNSVLSTKNKLQ